MITKTSPSFTEADLAQFIGTMQYFFNPLFKSFRYTDGVKFVSDNGAAWLITDILAILCHNPKVKAEEFVTIKFVLQAEGGWLTIDDGNGNILCKQEYGYADLPVDDISFFACDNVLMLVSEY